MEVMMLGAEFGTVLHFEARGSDAKEAIDALVAFFASDFYK
jgi:phosphotransferase system HPr-like phosphotransfer protein